MFRSRTSFSWVGAATLAAAGFLLLLPPARAQAPAAPTELTAYVVGADRAYLVWKDNSTNETGFQIDIGKVASGSFVPHTLRVSSAAESSGTGAYREVLSSTATTALLLEAGVQYQARVRAYNSVGLYSTAPAAVTFTTLSPAKFEKPSGLRVVTSQATHVRLAWTDEATIEDGYGYNFAIGGVGQAGLFGLTGVNGTTADLEAIGNNASIQPGTNYTFQVWGHRTVNDVLALTGGGTAANPAVSVTTATAQTFDPPGNFTGARSGDAGFQLSWSDNSTTEDMFEIQFREGTSGNMSLLQRVPWNVTSTDLGGDTGKPNTTYQFQVRATKTTGTNTTSTAWVGAPVTITTTFSAPANLVGTAPDETHISLTWTDNSNAETNFEVQYFDYGSNTFKAFRYPEANTTTLAFEVPSAGTYRFRVRATYGGGPDIFSGFSNEVTVNTLRAPTALSATPAGDREVNLAWVDNSALETSYTVYCRKTSASQPWKCATLPANSTSFTARAEDIGFNYPLLPNTSYTFQVAASTDFDESAAAAATASTKDGTVSDLSPPVFVNEAFSHAFTFSEGQASLVASSVSGTLPPGVSYNPGTRTLSGTPAARGAFVCTLQAQWSNGWTRSYPLHLRPVHRPGRPVAAGAIPNQSLALGGASQISLPLGSLFADPDAESAVLLRLPGADGTPSGREITIILYNSATPATVSNFLAYLENRTQGYTDAIFHRLVRGFILQGGAYKSSTAPGAPSNAFVSVPKLAAVANEPGISNVAGTLAMAKLPGNPHSATTDFFFNLGNNVANLDYQNEGFTVFGRVTAGSLGLLTGELNDLPLPPASSDIFNPNYAVTVDGSNTHFAELPTNMSGTAPASIDSSRLLRINDVVTGIPVLSPSLAGNTNPTAVSAAIANGSLQLTALAPGTAVISLQATDLDGNTLAAPLTFQVEVAGPGGFGQWAADQNLPPGASGPLDDADGDGRSNLEEYAFLDNPTQPGNHGRPVSTSVRDESGCSGAITLKVRHAVDLTYAVEAASSLTGAWSAIWTTEDGFSAANVVSAVDHPDHTELTVRDSVPVSPQGPRFLRVRVTQSP